MRRKIAFGVWIPVLVLALAMVTGPNRSAAAPSVAERAPTPIKPSASTSTTFPSPNAVIGKWVIRRRHKTAGGNIDILASKAALRQEIDHLGLRVPSAQRRKALLRRANASGVKN